MNNLIKEISLNKVKTRSQIAEEYGISRRTLYNWCKREGIDLPARGALCPKTQTKIYEVFGPPHSLG